MADLMAVATDAFNLVLERLDRMCDALEQIVANTTPVEKE